MANTEHLQVLRAGVPLWNDWRRRNPSLRPNLSNAALGRAEGYDSDDPYSTYMANANFREANLNNSNLSDICMVGADFAFADLSGSNFHLSNLDGALFYSARLLGTRLDYSTIVRSDFTGAQFGGVQLIGIDLSAAIGLETIRHSSPSRIDRETLEATLKGVLGRRVKVEQVSAIRSFLRRSGNSDLLEMLRERLRLQAG